MSDTPPNTITLQEAYRLFRDWFERDTPELPPCPMLPELEFEPRSGGDALEYPKVTDRAEEARRPALEWWAKVKERDLNAAAAFLGHLKTGVPELIARDPSTNSDVRLTPADWPDKPAFDDLLSPFDGPCISEPLDSPLARYSGLTPYIDRDEYDEWLANLQRPTADKKASNIAAVGSREGDQELKERIESVVEFARNRWGGGTKRPTFRGMAAHIKTQRKDRGFSKEALRQILSGRYATMKRLGLKGLD